MNFLEVDPKGAREGNCVMTIVDGNVVFEDL